MRVELGLVHIFPDVAEVTVGISSGHVNKCLQIGKLPTQSDDLQGAKSVHGQRCSGQKMISGCD